MQRLIGEDIRFVEPVSTGLVIGVVLERLGEDDRIAQPPRDGHHLGYHRGLFRSAPCFP